MVFLVLTERTILSGNKHSSCLHHDKINRPLKAPLRCKQAYMRAIRTLNMQARIKIFGFGTNIQKIQLTNAQNLMASDTPKDIKKGFGIGL